jgi:hypothetical protein
VIVTTVPEVEPVVDPQPLNAPPNVTVGEAGMREENAAGNVTVMVFVAARAPADVAVNVSVHVVTAAYVELPGANTTDVGAPEYTKVRVPVPVFPEPSVAVAVIVYVPTPSAVNEESVSDQLLVPVAPFCVTDAPHVCVVLFQ